MPRKGERKCPSCGEFSYPDPEDDLRPGSYPDPWEYGELSGRYICRGCYESDEEHASTIVRITSEGRESMRVGDDIAFDPEHGEIDDWFTDVFESRVYIRTDAWRGYYQTKLKGDYVQLGSGWVTSMPDHTTEHKRVAIDLDEFINNEFGWASLPDGAVLYWVFDQTSNVCSTASDLLVPVECAEAVKAWLIKHGFNLDDIESAFN